jgi:biopolymer transport protein ExbD
MAFNVGSDSGEDEINANINTTPLVDVMLVLLIIFLITIPVVTQTVPDNDTLVKKLKQIGVLNPQPEVHIRGDEKARYESVGRVVFACQRAGILKISFVTEPPPKG